MVNQTHKWIKKMKPIKNMCKNKDIFCFPLTTEKLFTRKTMLFFQRFYLFFDYKLIVQFMNCPSGSKLLQIFFSIIVY